MTPSLRMRVVEAMWDAYESRLDMQDALDAALVCLTENADEWANYPAEADPIVVAHREIIARKLLAVLREDR